MAVRFSSPNEKFSALGAHTTKRTPQILFSTAGSALKYYKDQNDCPR
jgi:hypothetical protein